MRPWSTYFRHFDSLKVRVYYHMDNNKKNYIYQSIIYHYSYKYFKSFLFAILMISWDNSLIMSKWVIEGEDGGDSEEFKENDKGVFYLIG